MTHDASEAAVQTAACEDNPAYEEIPALTHGDHHDIFAQWRATLPDEVRRLCNPASIGGFRRDLEFHFEPDVAQEQWNGWQGFHNEALMRRAATWLAERGFVVTWT